MSRTDRALLLLATIGVLLICVGTSSAASLKMASACNTLRLTQQTSTIPIFQPMTGIQIAKTAKYCRLARISVNKLKYWDKHENRWRLYPRHMDKKCWQINGLKESVPTCIMARKVVRQHTARIVRLNTAIVQLQARSLELYDGYMSPVAARQLGMMMAAGMGWTVDNGQFGCLDRLWGDLESSWNMRSDNPHSSAYGIPQALPGTKMGPRWLTSAWAQIRWGFGYIIGRYGTPCSALDWRLSHGWY